jgi:hypothetical protein
MFVGHYAASLALKKVEPKASLGMLFLAVQFVDILFFPFVLMGVERLNIIENFTDSTHFELVFMPYTHSLAMTFVWAALAYGLFRLIAPQSKRVALVMALAVMSHWFLDLLVHTPDLPLWSDDSTKLGFGLWNNAVATFALEAILLLGATWLYAGATTATTAGGKYAIWVFAAVMLLINAVNIFGPLTDDNIVSFTMLPLALYFILAGVAFWLDRKRS